MKHMKYLNKINKKKGFSLIELLLVLGIIASISIAAFFTYKYIDDKMVAEKNHQIVNEYLIALENFNNNITLYADEDGNVEYTNVVALLDEDYKKKYYVQEDEEFKLKTGEVFIGVNPLVFEEDGKMVAYVAATILNNGKSGMNSSQCVNFLNKFNNGHYLIGFGKSNEDQIKNISLDKIVEACESEREDFFVQVSLGGIDINTPQN